MRKSNLFLFLALFANVLSLTANKFIRLQFQPDFPIDSIRIDNLDSISSFTFVGEESLNVYMEEPTGVENTVLESDKLKVFSSRDRNEVQLSFYQQIPGLTTCEVFTVQGKMVARFSRFLESSCHRFTFVPDSRGMFLVRVCSPASILTAKFSSYGTTSIASLFYDGFTDTAEVSSAPPSFKTPSNQNKPMVVRQDDLLRICCYSGSKSQVIYDYANGDKNYVLHFTDRYHQLQLLYRIWASQTGIVDAVVSVTDASGRGVDDLSNDDFVVKEDGSPLTAAESFLQVNQTKQIPFTCYTVLLIDNSAGDENELAGIKEAALNFIGKIRPEQSVLVSEYSETIIGKTGFTKDKQKLRQAITSIEPGKSSSNLYGSVIRAQSLWKEYFTLKRLAQSSLIVLARGDDTSGLYSLDDVIGARGSCKVYMIGLGNKYSPDVLSKIASPSKFISVSNTDGLDEAFNRIQADIVRYSKSFYWLNYCSDKQSGTHSIEVSTSANTNTSATSKATGSYSVSEYIPANDGLYVNVDEDAMYGTDYLYCFYNGESCRFRKMRFGVSSYDDSQLLLKATTYGATYPPEYSWKIENGPSLKLSNVNSSMRMLTGEGGDTITATLTVKDVANNYTKQIPIELHPEFPLFGPITINEITSRTATFNGMILNEGSVRNVSRGFEWGAYPNESIWFTEIQKVGVGKGSFSQTIYGLEPGTRYIVRAYARTEAYVDYYHYSEQRVSFTTLAILPQITTSYMSSSTSSSATTGGKIERDGGAAVTARGVCWSRSPNPTINDSYTNDGTGIGSFISTLSNLKPGVIYYVRAYATNSVGTAYGKEVVVYLTFEGEVFNAITGKVWMDRNLGADRVATSVTDSAAFGDLYQWGRGTDGHEKRNSPTTSVLSNDDVPGHGMFIVVETRYNNNWRIQPNNNLWQGVQGINNPCPEGFRVPTIVEWNSERTSWIPKNAKGAFESPLKLTMAGSREESEGVVELEGTNGSYWSSKGGDSSADYITFDGSSSTHMTTSLRAQGSSVRCIKEVGPTP